MNIPTEIAWEIGLAIFGFVFGALWGHHGAIGKRVKYSDCEKNREKCPCKERLEEFESVFYGSKKDV